ncbi:hypothetical protein P691DRAFT_239638 [Macrolepiota fuliginosa MF-IS2]|uniref:DUF6534 domain-containing protein n=1 Tax=Macrolepiota fuliginosa MF-IS2 TaxID=1400762 RepID=A0A9P5X7I0_9AGAR|nr:hypothetical protein P691DRAFT_239638 [Macrolepiota fuliginosa MF-IS2]
MTMVRDSPLSSIMASLASTQGAMLIGVLFAVFSQGILSVQVYDYYMNFSDDPRRTKFFVALLWALDLTHLALIAYSIYYYLILNWGDTPALSHRIAAFNWQLLFIGLSTLLSQTFFLFRIWIFSERNVCIVTPVLLSILATFSLLIAGFGRTSRTITAGGPAPLFIAGAVTDFMIAGILCYYVRKKSEGTRRMRLTRTLVNQVIRYTVATTALTSLLVLACLTAYLAAPHTSFFIALHFSSGRTYSIAVLVNLNARRKFRETIGSVEASFVKSTEYAGVSRGMPGPRLNRSTLDQPSRGTTTRSGIATVPTVSEISVRLPLRTYPPRSRWSLP